MYHEIIVWDDFRFIYTIDAELGIFIVPIYDRMLWS